MTRRVKAKQAKADSGVWSPMRRKLDQEQREDFQAMLQGNHGEAWANDRYFAIAEETGPRQAHLMIRRHDFPEPV